MTDASTPESAPAPPPATTTTPPAAAPAAPGERARPPTLIGIRTSGLFTSPRGDLIAGTVVFLVALPLCLGIAVASGAPPLAGIVAGICGGLVIPIISRATLSVAGPAAGLTAIVVSSIATLGSWSAVACAVFLSGLIQMIFGAVRAGNFASIVPSSVIKGMLSAIGVVLILNQINVVIGVPADMIEIDYLLLSAERGEHWSAMVRAAEPGTILIAGVSIALIIVWPKTRMSKLTWMSSSLVVVVIGTLMALAFENVSALRLPPDQLIVLPSIFEAGLDGADFSALRKSATWTIALTIAVVASIESLLSIEALDRLDPARRRTPKNRELVAHGLGNAISGLLGGLPITSVIVRSTANVQAGAKTKLSALFHGLLLFIAVLVLAPLLRHIPLACLAAILLHIGVKLASPTTFRAELRVGYEAWLPFAVTIFFVVTTNLFRGVLIGFLVSILVVLKHATRDTVVMKRDGKTVHVDFLRDGTFLVKPALMAILEDVQNGETVIIDCTNEMIDIDVREVLTTFARDARHRGITVDIRGLEGAPLESAAAAAH